MFRRQTSPPTFPGLLLLLLLPLALATGLPAQSGPTPHAASQLVLIDTDIGDDIDDAFALALALQSPDLHILGITTTFGDTALRARLLHRLLTETGHADIPVAAGPPTSASNVFTQRHYAERSSALPPETADAPSQAAVDLFARTVRAHPHEVTLIALGPLTTVEAILDRDPAAFHLLHRVVMMGGSIRAGYRPALTGARNAVTTPPDPEWNIQNGIAGARKLLASGVPLTLLPLDSTQIPLDEVHRQAIFVQGSPVTDALTLLYHQWGGVTPTLFDPLTVATVIDPTLCPATPMRLRIDDKGNTLVDKGGAPNAQVCLRSHEEAFLDLLLARLLGTPMVSSPPQAQHASP